MGHYKSSAKGKVHSNIDLPQETRKKSNKYPNSTPKAHPRSGVAAERSNPTSREWQLCGPRRAKRSYSTFKVRRGGREEIPLIQGKRNPSKTIGVARGHQRADTLKP